MAAAPAICYFCHCSTAQADGAFAPCDTCTGTISTVHHGCFKDYASHRRQSHPWEVAPLCTICRRYSTNPTALALFNSAPPAPPPAMTGRSAPINIPCAPRARAPAPTPGPVAAAPPTPAAARAFWLDLAAENQLPSCAGCLHPSGACELNCARAARLAALLAAPAPFDYTTPLLPPATPTPVAAAAPASRTAPAARSAVVDTGVRGLPAPVPVKRYLPDGWTLPVGSPNTSETRMDLWGEVAARRDLPGGAGNGHDRWRVIRQ